MTRAPKSPSAPPRPAKVEVLVVERLIVDTKSAARLICRSPTTLKNWRTASGPLVEAGRPPIGPRWILLNDASIVYEVDELRRWIREHGVPCGKAAFRGPPGPGLNGEEAEP